MPDKPKPMTQDEIADLEEETAEVRLSKSQIMSIRLNDRELRTLAAAAHLVGLKVGAFIKQAALDAAETQRLGHRPTVDFGVPGEGYAFTGFIPQLRDSGSPGSVEIEFTAGAGVVLPTGN